MNYHFLSRCLMMGRSLLNGSLPFGGGITSTDVIMRMLILCHVH